MRKSIIILVACLLICMLPGCGKKEQIVEEVAQKDDFDISIAEEKLDPSNANNYTPEYYNKLYKENAILNEKLRIYSESEVVYDGAKTEYIASQIYSKSTDEEIANAVTSIPYKKGIVDIEALNKAADEVSIDVTPPAVSQDNLYEVITELEARNKAITERIEEIKSSY